MAGLALGVLAVGVGLCAVGGVMLTEARRIRRDADRNVERTITHANTHTDGLVDRILHLVGNTWTLPPAMLSETRATEEEPPEQIRRDLEAFTSPDYSAAAPASGNGSGVL